MDTLIFDCKKKNKYVATLFCCFGAFVSSCIINFEWKNLLLWHSGHCAVLAWEREAADSSIVVFAEKMILVLAVSTNMSLSVPWKTLFSQFFVSLHGI